MSSTTRSSVSLSVFLRRWYIYCITCWPRPPCSQLVPQRMYIWRTLDISWTWSTGNNYHLVPSGWLLREYMCYCCCNKFVKLCQKVKIYVLRFFCFPSWCFFGLTTWLVYLPTLPQERQCFRTVQGEQCAALLQIVWSQVAAIFCKNIVFHRI